MTNSFQSTAATNIYDSPVNTFVNPVSVLPKTGMMELADTLKTINPALQTYLEGQIEKDINEMIIKGKTKEELQKIISDNTYSGLSAITQLNSYKRC